MTVSSTDSRSPTLAASRLRIGCTPSRAAHVRLRDGAHPTAAAGWNAFAGVSAWAANAATPLPAAPSTPAPAPVSASAPSPTAPPTVTAAPTPTPSPTETYTVPPENAGPVALPTVVAPAPVPSAASIAWWKEDGAAWTAGWRNGQCTELAWKRRPDIVELVAEDGHLSWSAAIPTPALRVTYSRERSRRRRRRALWRAPRLRGWSWSVGCCVVCGVGCLGCAGGVVDGCDRRAGARRSRCWGVWVLGGVSSGRGRSTLFRGRCGCRRLGLR
jgi:hypothetical protein